MPDIDLPTANPTHLKRAAMVGAAVLAVVLIAGAATRVMSARALDADTRAMAIPTVVVIQPKQGAEGGVSLPGRLQPWAEAPVYARTSGYIRAWRVDIGAHVRAGQVLAEIDSPEVDQQLASAQASLGVAQAQLDLAQSTADRWRKLLEAGTVAQQAADEKLGDFAAKRAMRDQASAEVGRLRALQGFKRVVAPFDGVVTSRTADVGALVTAGSGAAEPLFTIADDRRLRLYVSLPENQSAMLRPGGSATFTVPDQAGQTFTAVLANNANAVDPRTGTMTVQLTVDNAAGTLRPGGYARVALQAAATGAPSEIRIPASALLFRKEGAAVAVVGAGDHVAIRSVAIARDDGKELAIGTGLTGHERIIDNPSSAITEGQQVRIAVPAA